MDCAACGRHNETAAVFCVYCGIRLETANQRKPVQPALGKTIDLRRESGPAVQSIPVTPKLEPVVPPMPVAQPIVQRERSGKSSNDGLVVLGLLVLGLLMFSNVAIESWQLIMMGFGVLVSRQSHQAAVWLIGIPILAITNWWWGIVLLVIFSNHKSHGCGMKHSYKH
ncbi:MAG TPA: hypothetical protein DEF47_24060 [Herpetosiphon sp.]|uniref:Zinc-ribbon domain-containing protein n=1 Tax=Herpetosiphon aurantiacus (strain ATCC 23779 / DSM 785 / 114-95) TaxID=316274 RepID=A9AXR8_HERA2|nr:hypothetical protein [Herpetosiphon sp.]ABX03482.1 hypothetical protein Haur_0834 [Herpetosiphon aurantiacus DSM 785]HBW52969.1 hypothetical protein [Herpetosiphon sp.]